MRIGRSLGLFAVLLAACTSSEGTPRRDGLPTLLGDGTLLLGSETGIVTVDLQTGTAVDLGVPRLGDWSTAYRAEEHQGRTIVEGVDTASGDVASRISLRGQLDVRVASWNGTRIALMAPLEVGDTPWTPRPRSQTEIVVADPRGVAETRRYVLEGNFEPEAFSTRARSLYLVRYVPPMAPTGYRVARLSLSDGEVYPVTTPTKGLPVVETMQGTRLEQVASPDGTMLHTLYTTAPPTYASGSSSAEDPPHQAGFVHVLDLNDGWAHCVSLPRRMWDSDPAHQAIALSSSGRQLYIVDVAAGMIAVMDPSGPEISRTADLDLGPADEGETSAVVTDDGHLYVATGTHVTAVDAITLERVDSWTTSSPVTALGEGAGGLLLGSADGVRVVEPASGRPIGAIPSPAAEGTAYVGVVEP